MGLEQRTYQSTPHCTIHSTTTDSHRQCTNPWYFNLDDLPRVLYNARGHVQRGTRPTGCLPLTGLVKDRWSLSRVLVSFST